MEKQPRVSIRDRVKARIGRFMMINLDNLDSAHDVFEGEDDLHTTLLDDTQEMDLSVLRDMDSEHLVRGEE